MLKHGNNAEIRKTWFSINCMNCPGVSHTCSVGKPITLEVWKTFSKTLSIRKLNFYISPFHTDVPIRFHALRTLGDTAMEKS